VAPDAARLGNANAATSRAHGVSGSSSSSSSSPRAPSALLHRSTFMSSGLMMLKLMGPDMPPPPRPPLLLLAAGAEGVAPGTSEAFIGVGDGKPKRARTVSRSPLFPYLLLLVVLLPLMLL